MLFRVVFAETWVGYHGNLFTGFIMKTFFRVLLLLLLFSTFLHAQTFRRGEMVPKSIAHCYCVASIACNGLNKVDSRLKALFTRLSSPVIIIPQALDAAILCHKDFKKYFDLSKPMVAFYVVSVSTRQDSNEIIPSKTKSGWVFGVNNRREINKEWIEIAGIKFWVTYYHKMLYLSRDKNLSRIPKDVPEVHKIKNCDIQFNLKCARFANLQPKLYEAFGHYMFENWLKKMIHPENAEKSPPIIKKQLEALREFMKQAEEVTLDLNICPNKLEMKVELTPLRNSLMSNFVEKQSKYRGSPPSVLGGKHFCLSGAIEPFQPYVEFIKALVLQIMANNKSDTSKKYAEYLNYCISKCDGRFNCFIDSPGDSISRCNFRLKSSGYVDLKSKLRTDSSCKLLGKDFYRFNFDPLNNDSKSEFFYCCYGRETTLVEGTGAGDAKSINKLGRGRQIRVSGRNFLYALLCDGKKNAAELSAGLDRDLHINLDISIYEPLLRRVFPKESEGGKKPVSDLVKILRNL